MPSKNSKDNPKHTKVFMEKWTFKYILDIYAFPINFQQEPWMLQGYSDQNKMQFSNPSAYNFRYENNEDIDTDTKVKRVKTTKDTGFSVRKAPEVPTRNTKNINKNTYVHKINHLIHDSDHDSSSPISNDM